VRAALHCNCGQPARVGCGKVAAGGSAAMTNEE